MAAIRAARSLGFSGIGFKECKILVEEIADKLQPQASFEIVDCTPKLTNAERRKEWLTLAAAVATNPNFSVVSEITFVTEALMYCAYAQYPEAEGGTRSSSAS